MARKRAVDEDADRRSTAPIPKRARYASVSPPSEDSNPKSPSAPSEATTTDLPTYSDSQSLAPTSATTTATSSKRPKRYLCTYENCTKAFDRPVRLQAHIRTHTNDRPFICTANPTCTKSFFKSEHLKAHVLNKHSESANFVCEYILHKAADGDETVCGKAFTTSTRLKRHLAAHEQKEGLRCSANGCGLEFRKIETLQRHVKKVHLLEDPFRCSKAFTPGSLSGNDVAWREECGKTFPTISQLKAHEIKVHVGHKYFCELCPFESSLPYHGQEETSLGFDTYTDYQAHLKSVHPPTCALCGATHPSNRALTAHMEIAHSTLASRQNFTCTEPDCGRAFTRKGNLAVHVQAVHVKAKNFTCGINEVTTKDKEDRFPGWSNEAGCGSQFSTKASLEEHIRTLHLGLPSPYHPRKTSRHEKQASTKAANPVSTAAKPDTLALLTGYGYSDLRPLPCWSRDCERRFVRDYDLALHMEMVHGWNVDDINERFAWIAALGSGVQRAGHGVSDAVAMQLAGDMQRDEDHGRDLGEDLSMLDMFTSEGDADVDDMKDRLFGQLAPEQGVRLPIDPALVAT